MAMRKARLDESADVATAGTVTAQTRTFEESRITVTVLPTKSLARFDTRPVVLASFAIVPLTSPTTIVRALGAAALVLRSFSIRTSSESIVNAVETPFAKSDDAVQAFAKYAPSALAGMRTRVTV
jgi:hypothetical protein